MKDIQSKGELSSSAKKIKQELESVSIKTLSHQSILQIIEMKANLSLEGAYNPSYSLIGLSKKEELIKEIIYEKTGFKPYNVDFLKRKIDKRVAVFREAAGTYTLPQYMQYYKFLTHRDPFKEDLLTNTLAIEKSKDFVFDLCLKYKEVSDYNVRKYLENDAKSIDFKNLEELYIILKKKENGTHLSNCDIVLNEIIKKIFNFRVLNPKLYESQPDYLLEEIKKIVVKEIIRVKVLSETRLDYRFLVEAIDPYHFPINTDKENDLVTKVTNENKSFFKDNNGIYFGSTDKNSSLLSSQLKIEKMFNKDYVVLKSLKKRFSFFENKELIGLTNKQLEDGLYTSSTIGSGYMETLFPYFIQQFSQNESVVFFDVYNGNRIANDLQLAKKIAEGKGGLVVIGNDDFLALTKEKMLHLLKKEKSIYFNLQATDRLPINKFEKQITKIQYLTKIIGEYKKSRYYSIFINDANIVFSEKNKFSKDFADNFHEMKKSFDKTKLMIRGTGSLNKEMFEKFKYKMLMKTECEMSFDIFDTVDFKQKGSNIEDYSSYKIFRKNIMDLSPGEFIFVVDNKVSLKNKIYKSSYYSSYNLSDDNSNFNYDLND